ncbi:hypothetical protein STEG23_031143, partial [Scotinomys teguina]
FEEPEDPSNRSFFSEIISSISDVKFSHSGRYIMTRDYLTVKVWDLNMENRPIETYQVHDYLRSKLCSLYENDCIFDKFECVWNGSDSVIMTGSYNNFFRMFDRNTKRDVTLEASRENSKPRAILKPRKVCVGGKRRKDEIITPGLKSESKLPGFEIQDLPTAGLLVLSLGCGRFPVFHSFHPPFSHPTNHNLPSTGFKSDFSPGDQEASFIFLV